MSQRNYLIKIGASLYLTDDGTSTGTKCKSSIPGFDRLFQSYKKTLFRDFHNNPIIIKNETNAVGEAIQIQVQYMPFEVADDLIDLSNTADSTGSTVPLAITDAYTGKTFSGAALFDSVSFQFQDFSRLYYQGFVINLVITEQSDASNPTAPASLTEVSNTATTSTVSFTASTDNVAVTAYQYRLDSGAWRTFGTLTGTSTLTGTISGLTTATTYAVTVRAVDGAGNVSTASNSISITTD